MVRCVSVRQQIHAGLVGQDCDVSLREEGVLRPGDDGVPVVGHVVDLDPGDHHALETIHLAPAQPTTERQADLVAGGLHLEELEGRARQGAGVVARDGLGDLLLGERRRPVGVIVLEDEVVAVALEPHRDAEDCPERLAEVLVVDPVRLDDEVVVQLLGELELDAADLAVLVAEQELDRHLDLDAQQVEVAVREGDDDVLVGEVGGDRLDTVDVEDLGVDLALGAVVERPHGDRQAVGLVVGDDLDVGLGDGRGHDLLLGGWVVRMVHSLVRASSIGGKYYLQGKPAHLPNLSKCFEKLMLNQNNIIIANY